MLSESSAYTRQRRDSLNLLCDEFLTQRICKFLKINTCKTGSVSIFRINTYKKQGVGASLSTRVPCWTAPTYSP